MDEDFDHHLVQMENAANVLEMRDIAVFLRAFPKTEALGTPEQS